MSLLEVFNQLSNNTFDHHGPAMNWKKTSESHVFEIDLPGFRKEDVTLQIHQGRVVHINAERKEEGDDEEKGSKWHCRERLSGGGGSFSRQFSLPQNAKADEIKASMRDGVLVVEVPKMKELKERKKMGIEISGDDLQETQPSSKGLGRFLCCKA